MLLVSLRTGPYSIQIQLVKITLNETSTVGYMEIIDFFWAKSGVSYSVLIPGIGKCQLTYKMNEKKKISNFMQNSLSLYYDVGLQLMVFSYGSSYVFFFSILQHICDIYTLQRLLRSRPFVMDVLENGFLIAY